MCVMDLNEFSDHCAVTFKLPYNVAYKNCSNNRGKRIICDALHKDELLESLSDKKQFFDNLVGELNDGNCDINYCINSLSSKIHEIYFQHYGKTFSNNRKYDKCNTPWFDNNCRASKSTFYNVK